MQLFTLQLSDSVDLGVSEVAVASENSVASVVFSISLLVPTSLSVDVEALQRLIRNPLHSPSQQLRLDIEH